VRIQRITSLSFMLTTMISTLVAGCSSSSNVISTDLTRQSGLYIVAYVDREDVRAKLEDQFVQDLDDQGIRAVASRHDIKVIKDATPTTIVRAANTHKVAAVVIVNRVSKDGGDSIIKSDQGISPSNTDLHAYYDATRGELDNYGNDDPIFAEVNAFLVDGSKTRRFWTGTTWTFEGQDDEVVSTISETIAAELAKVAGELRSYGRPIN
jgi:hypothetical protein